MAKAAQSGMPAVGNLAGTTHFQPANDTKKILLDPAQPDKFGVGEHHLHVRLEAKPVKQPLGRFAEERRKAIGEEIALLAAGFIMEVLHRTGWRTRSWKKNGSWRMCIDYTSLNKACPKDPLPPAAHRSSHRLQAARLLSFLDASSGYHQIPLNPADQIKTSFITPSKQNYPHYQKVTYGVYMAAKKLKHYFQEHPIKVVATAPLAKSSAAKTPTAGSPSGRWSWRPMPSIRAKNSHQVARS
ncbi:hypothetical protein QYE76_031163 [Lolium multiflorum]|uniref:Reverse transcriptase domain-containing protein n=1 Tax=Lolium multiflorum TaxID=4521 RepID=A0AAD8VJX9_LOLMU|nr:hypothetical protein QYE76_031163 [Lolium multiflorum]